MSRWISEGVTPDDLAGQLGGGGGGAPLPESKVVGVNGQTVFALDFEPSDPLAVVLVINGVSYFSVLPTAFSITGPTNQVLTWLDSPMPLTTSDVVTIYYPRA